MPAGHLMSGHLVRGRRGEDVAHDFVRSVGMTVLTRNWRGKRGELDLVCKDGDTLVFVEVKTRDRAGMAAPHDALTPEKQRRLVRAAEEYLSRNKAWDQPCRFDLVAVTMGGDGQGAQVEHIENAFILENGGGGKGGGWQPW